ncbi:MAG: GNAT family N-acetyltransferase [Bacteroidota bacterium]
MFDFTETYILENELVRLSPFEETHVEDLFLLSQEEAIWTYFIEEGMGRENFRKYVDAALLAKKDGREYPFVITDARTNLMAGMTRIYDLNLSLGHAKIGHSWIGIPFQGTAVNKASKYLLCQFLFEEMGLERVGFGISEENRVSLSAVKSIGAIEEGRLRSFLPAIHDQGRVDIVLMSMLKQEWEESVKNMLQQKLQSWLKEDVG